MSDKCTFEAPPKPEGEISAPPPTELPTNEADRKEEVEEEGKGEKEGREEEDEREEDYNYEYGESNSSLYIHALDAVYYVCFNVCSMSLFQIKHIIF